MHDWVRVALVLGLVACSSDGGPATGPAGAIESVDLTLSGEVTGHATAFTNHPAFPATACGGGGALVVIHWSQEFAGRAHAFHVELPRRTGEIPLTPPASFAVVANDIDRYAPGEPDGGRVVLEDDRRTYRVDARLVHNRSRRPLRVVGTMVCRAALDEA